ncbi:MAG: ATP-binding protein [Chitinophagales bacterium]
MEKLIPDAVKLHDADIQAIVDISPYPIVVHFQGEIRYVNKLVWEALRMDSSLDLIGRNVTEFIHPEDKVALIAAIKDGYSRNDKDTITELRFIDQQGEIIPIHSRSTNVVFNGELCRLVYLYNFDKVKLVEERVRKEREDELLNYQLFQEKVNATSPVCIAILDINSMRTVYRSMDMSKWLLYEPNSVPESSLELIHPDYRKEAANAISEVRHLKDGEVFTTLFPFLQGNGEIRFLLSRCSVFLRDAAGVPQQILIAHSDVTDLKNVETRLGESEESRMAILYAIPDMVFRVARDGTIDDYYPNEMHREILGSVNFVGQSINAIVPDEHVQNVVELIAKTIETGELQSLEFEQCERDYTFYYEFRFSPLNEKQVIVIVRDVSDMKAIQRQLDLSNKELFRKNEQLERYITSNTELEKFAYIASHDLREPLRSLTGFAQLLQRRNAGLLSAESEDFIQNIINGAQRMNTLISGLLDFSRVSTSGKPFTTVQLDDLLKKVQTDLKVTIEETQTSFLIYDLPEIYCDELQFRQLFQNLISNAIKFRSAQQPLIRISAERSGDNWLFKVEDNGIGMDMKYKEQVFQLFTRLHSQDKYQGSGIGLSICRKIMERHNGKIWLESSPGKGTSVFFTFPA